VGKTLSHITGLERGDLLLWTTGTFRPEPTAPRPNPGWKTTASNWAGMYLKQSLMAAVFRPRRRCQPIRVAGCGKQQIPGVHGVSHSPFFLSGAPGAKTLAIYYNFLN
jgi:hypothetical protein